MGNLRPELRQLAKFHQQHPLFVPAPSPDPTPPAPLSAVVPDPTPPVPLAYPPAEAPGRAAHAAAPRLSPFFRLRLWLVSLVARALCIPCFQVDVAEDKALPSGEPAASQAPINV